MNQLNHSSDNGLVVFNARVMHNLLNPNQFTMYGNNCAGTSNKMAPKADEENSIVINFTVYPNPTDGSFKIGSTSQVTQNLQVEIFDIIGKKVFAENCTFTGQDCQFFANVANGLCLIKIVNKSTNDTIIKKVVLQ